MNIIHSVTDLIGQTPLLALDRLQAVHGLQASLYAKMELMNPGGSVKDRIAKQMIRAAEKNGLLKPGMTIVEPTSGNTGIGLAMVGAALGYRVVLTMPESMSIERRQLLKAYGAELILTEASAGMTGAINKARELVETNQKAFMPSQFENPANPEAHRRTTALEIIESLDGRIDAFVAGVGTGGTVTGVGTVLKQQISKVSVVAVEPVDSAVLSGNQAGPHKIQGIGAGFIPTNLDQQVYDEIIQVDYQSAKQTAVELARLTGVCVGISSGANVYAAIEMAKRPIFKGANIVTILCDTGERYLSTGLYD